MFDLPTDSEQARRAYTRFRKELLKDGFGMMQYSVYIRHCPSYQNRDIHVQRIKKSLPDDGEVRVLVVTDKQFEQMAVFLGKQRKPAESAPAQLEFF